MVTSNYRFEYVAGGVQNRGRFVDSSELTESLEKETRPDVYASVFTYPALDLEGHISKEGSIRNYTGKLHLEGLPFDIDRANLEEALKDARDLCCYLVEGMQIPAEALRISFSGNKGFHAVLPASLLGNPADSPDNAKRCKRIALELSSGIAIDEKIYDSTRIFRIVNTKNAKSGLYKIPLTYNELRTLTVDEIKALAKGKRKITVTPADEFFPVPELQKMWNAEPKQESGLAKKEPTGDNSLIAAIKAGPQNGNRNEVLFNTARALSRRGVDTGLAEALLTALNKTCKVPLPNGELLTTLKSAYRYSSGPVENTNPIANLLSLKDAGMRYHETVRNDRRYSTGFAELDKHTRGLGAGQVLTICGTAAVFKSALVENALMNHVRGGGKGLFFTLEMSAELVFERATTIHSGLDTSGSSGEEVWQAYKSFDNPAPVVEDLANKYPGFIMCEKSDLDLKEIAEYINLARENLFQGEIPLVAIDYIGLIGETGRNETERITEIARGVKRVAKAQRVPIILLAHTNKNAGDGTEPVTAAMVRDSGAVQDACDFLLGLWKDPDTPEDKREGAILGRLIKNRMGKTGEIRLTVDRRTLRIFDREGAA